MNELDQSIEIVFLVPTDQNLTCNKVEIDYHLDNGQTESFTTQVVKRETAEMDYTKFAHDKQNDEEGTGLADLPQIESNFTSNMLKIALGSMPALCTARLRAYFS